MKPIFRIMSMLAMMAGMGFSSCSEQEDVPALSDAQIILDEPEVRLGRTGRYYEVEVQAPAACTVQSTAEWLTLTSDGSTRLTGTLALGVLPWQKADQPGVVTCELSSVFPSDGGDLLPFDRMFAGEKEQILCRTPNRQPGKLPLEGAATRAQLRHWTEACRDPAGGRLRALHKAGWGGESFAVVGKDPRSEWGLRLDWLGDNNRGSEPGAVAVLENVREALDAPGEWFFDRNTARLYWMPPAPEDVERPIALSTRASLLQITGKAQPARQITIQNLTFEKTAGTLFPLAGQSLSPYEPLLRGDWCVRREAAVRLENAEDCTLRRCRFADIGGNGILLSGYNARITITENELSRLGATAIQILGEAKAVWEPSFWAHEHYPALPVHRNEVEHPEKRGARTEDYPRDILISENHIAGVGLLEKQSCGVNLSICRNVSILHNTIHDSPRALLNINDGCFGGHEIGYNELFDSQKETEDHGPINSWGRDRFWSVPKYNAMGKYGSRLRRYPKDGKAFDLSALDQLAPNRIHHNRLHHAPDAPHSWGIDLDDGSSRYEIDHNLLLGLGVKLREGFDRYVHDNIMLLGNLQIHVPYEEARDRIENNRIFAGEPVGTAVCDKKRYRKAQIQMKNNVFLWNKASLRLPAYLPRQRTALPTPEAFPFPAPPQQPKAELFKAPESPNPPMAQMPVAPENPNPPMAQMPVAPESPWLPEGFAPPYYGKRDCTAQPPLREFAACAKQRAADLSKEAPARRRKLRLRRGAIVTPMTEALRSATAHKNAEGDFVLHVIFPFFGIKKGDILPPRR